MMKMMVMVMTAAPRGKDLLVVVVVVLPGGHVAETHRGHVLLKGRQTVISRVVEE